MHNHEHKALVDPVAAVSLLKKAWGDPELGRRCLRTAEKAAPLAGGPYDQVVPEGVENPYWEVVRWLPSIPPAYGGDGVEPLIDMSMYFSGAENRELWEATGGSRSQMAAQYAWSIPTPGDVAWMVGQLGGLGVVEIGAGTGYWAWQLEQAGVDVVAYDPVVPGPQNPWCGGGPYTDLRIGGAEAAADHGDRALLMIWPPYEDPCAEKALRAYQGSLLLYAGERQGGCTGADGFYELLAEEWELVDTSPDHMTWWSIRCALRSYHRKPKAGTAGAGQ